MKDVGSIVERGRNRFAVVIYRGPRDSEEAHQDWWPVHGNRDNARSLRRRLNVQIEDGTYRSPTHVRMSDLIPGWESDVYPTIRPGTIRNYKFIARNLIAHLGKIEVGKLTLGHIRAYRNVLLEKGSVRGGPLSPKTVKDRLIVLRCVLDKAVSEKMIASNPMRGIPRTGGHEAILPRVEHPEIMVFDETEISMLLGKLRGHRLELPGRIMLDCGLRVGEVMGLAFNEVDLVTGQLSVYRQRGRTGEARTPTKSNNGLRTVPMGPGTLALVRDALEAHALICRLPSHGRCDVVPPGPRGSSTPLSLTRSFKRFLEGHGWPHAFCHTLRHTFATRQILAGTDAKTLSYWMGHSDPGFTLRAYAHWFDRIASESAIHRKRDLPAPTH